ncbi:hypothetical protein K7432_007814 [Basidiobolus ranarum]|uniref:Uncharacterized protein n=1 Tax=Basidiobolus ranarum TaxID=34480 RepID=A0ABR2W0I3_9FUNG
MYHQPSESFKAISSEDALLELDIPITLKFSYEVGTAPAITMIPTTENELKSLYLRLFEMLNLISSGAHYFEK